MKKIIPLFKKYLPDILIVLGVLIVSYNYLRPVAFCPNGRHFCEILSYNYHISNKLIGITSFTIGIILAVRRYHSSKTK